MWQLGKQWRNMTTRRWRVALGSDRVCVCLCLMLVWLAASTLMAEQPAPTRAFQMPTPEATDEAVHAVWVVGGIGLAGVVLIFICAYYFYAPRASQRPFRPTVIIESPPVPQCDLEEAFREKPLEDKDRWDLEAEMGDYLKRLDGDE